MIVRFEIPGPPRSKGRHRTTKKGVYYTPDDTVRFENLVMLCYRQNHKRMTFPDGPISIMIVTYFLIPKSASKKRQALMLSGEIRPTVTPDFENIAKVICDSLNQVAYRDDAQIVSATLIKAYGNEANTVVTMRTTPTNELSHTYRKVIPTQAGINL